MPSRIIVLGMFRSGTSLNARLVQSWGAYAGAEEDLFSDRYGYLEHLGLQRLNDDLMDHNDRLPPASDLLAQRAQDRVLRQRAEQLLEQMDHQAEAAGQPAWLWKDPRLPMLLPFWVPLWGDVVYVITVRHPLEIVKSAAEMDGVEAGSMALAAGLIYWQCNMLRLLAATQASRRKIFVAFDQLTSDPFSECTRLCSFLDQQCGPAASPEGSLRVDQLASHVQAGERHYTEPGSLALAPQATREQRLLYNFLRVKVQYPDEAYVETDFALSPGWLDFLQAIDLLSASTRAPEA